MDTNTINEFLNNLTWQQIFLFIFCSGWVVEVVPVFKWNPITWILEWIGNRANHNLIDKLDRVEKENDMRRIKDLKSEILAFSRSLKRFESDGMADDFDEEDFDHIFSSYEEYEVLLTKYGMSNGKTTRAMTMINRCSETHGYGVIILK